MSALTPRESQWDQCICLDDKACMLPSGYKAGIAGAICSLQLPVLPSRGRQAITLLKSPNFLKGSQLLNKIGRASWLKVYNVKGMLGLPWWYTRGYNLGTEGRINLREEKSQVLNSDQMLYPCRCLSLWQNIWKVEISNQRKISVTVAKNPYLGQKNCSQTVEANSHWQICLTSRLRTANF